MWASPARRKSSRTSSSISWSWPITMPRASAASSGSRPWASASSARRRIVSSTPARPPRRPPVASTASRSSSATTPRPARKRAQSKSDPGVVSGGDAYPATSSSAPGARSAGHSSSPSARARTFAPAASPVTSSISAWVPKVVGRGRSSRIALASTDRPSPIAALGASICTSLAPPRSAPPIRRAAASSPTVGARIAARAAAASAAPSIASSTGSGSPAAPVTARPRPSAPSPVW